jgi:poly-gamma-glutamate capsule biosynthesis protein CapA/YwtB (metallophosphatase superfamily)
MPGLTGLTCRTKVNAGAEAVRERQRRDSVMNGRLFVLLLFFCFLEPACAGEEELTLTFLGDIMIHPVNYCLTDYTVIYAAIAPYLRRDDLSFANLEFPVDASRPYAGYPCFNGSPAYVEAAVNAGVDVFSLANNHSFDQGREGVLQTLRAMEHLRRLPGRRINWSGLRGNLLHPFSPAEIRTGGFTIGFMAVTQMVNRSMPHGYVQVVDYRSPSQRREFLTSVRELASGYDLFILSYHGGIEYALEAEPGKIAFFRELAAAGVDIVYAHHPHVPQGAVLVPAAGGGTALILASTGNLISGMTWSIDPAHPDDPRAFTGDSALWQVRVVRRAGTVTVDRVRPLLVTNYRNSRNELVVVPFSGLLCRELPPPWRDYYRRRYRLLRAHLQPAGLSLTALE